MPIAADVVRVAELDRLLDEDRPGWCCSPTRCSSATTPPRTPTKRQDRQDAEPGVDVGVAMEDLTHGSSRRVFGGLFTASKVLAIANIGSRPKSLLETGGEQKCDSSGRHLRRRPDTAALRRANNVKLFTKCQTGGVVRRPGADSRRSHTPREACPRSTEALKGAWYDADLVPWRGTFMRSLSRIAASLFVVLLVSVPAAAQAPVIYRLSFPAPEHH